MTPVVVAVVLAAALLHASWNALAHGVKDQLVAFTLIGGGQTLATLPLLFFVPVPAAGAWPWLLTSVAVHIVYMQLLMRSFTLGDFGQAYPIARGTAPLVVTVVAVFAVDETLTGAQAVGVALATAGLLGVALWGIRTGRPDWPALTAAGATGLSIATYTVVDGIGVRNAETALGYTAWLIFLMGPLLPLYALSTRGRELAAQVRPFLARGLLGGLMSSAAYGLVLWAQTRAPLGPVAALRESSIIVGAAIGALFFKERFGAPRIAAAVLMVLGIGLMLRTG
ncbi:DMT family transporter [Streptomyces sp. NPDC051940]|uniref:DMT family transporter n=1 Tax=Streptomyces sp. NPDC051940 TaxID=3155675 RepID=UPI00342348CF